MQPDEYRRLSAACQAMAAQSSKSFTGEQVRWSRLAQRSSDLADEVALTLARRTAPDRLSASAAAR
jgi:hypothetical protein